MFSKYKKNSFILLLLVTSFVELNASSPNQGCLAAFTACLKNCCGLSSSRVEPVINEPIPNAYHPRTPQGSSSRRSIPPTAPDSVVKERAPIGYAGTPQEGSSSHRSIPPTPSSASSSYNGAAVEEQLNLAARTGAAFTDYNIVCSSPDKPHAEINLQSRACNYLRPFSSLGDSVITPRVKFRHSRTQSRDSAGGSISILDNRSYNPSDASGKVFAGHSRTVSGDSSGSPSVAAFPEYIAADAPVPGYVAAADEN